MKVIYMEQTLQLLATVNQDNPEFIKDLLSSGQVKETEDGKKYLAIEIEE